MTPQQQQCLDLVRTSIHTRGVAPSYPEIAKALGITSRGQAHAVVTALVRQGELVRTAATVRNVRLPDVDLRSATTAALEAELERRRG
jgi:SOS-response transcriptional repressor LexA